MMKSSESATTQGFVEHIDAGKIHPPRTPLRPTSEFVGSRHDHVEDLASSIMEKGLLCPIVVRPIDSFFEIVAGNRRFEACRRLGIKKIPCYVSEFDDKEAYEASLVENLQRRTLDPLEEAKAFKRYVDEFGYGSASELAGKIGKTPTYVSRRIALLKLPRKVQEKLLRSAKVGMAQELLPLIDDEDTAEELTELIVEKKVTTKNEVRRIVKHAKHSSHSRKQVVRGGVGESAFENKNILNHHNQQEEEDSFQTPFPRYYSIEQIRQHVLDRAFSKYIATLKVCMMRLDEVLDSLDENKEWVVRETLMQYRKSVHNQIDSLIGLKMRTQRLFELPAAALRM